MKYTFPDTVKRLQHPIDWCKRAYTLPILKHRFPTPISHTGSIAQCITRFHYICKFHNENPVKDFLSSFYLQNNLGATWQVLFCNWETTFTIETKEMGKHETTQATRFLQQTQSQVPGALYLKFPLTNLSANKDKPRCLPRLIVHPTAVNLPPKLLITQGCPNFSAQTSLDYEIFFNEFRPWSLCGKTDPSWKINCLAMICSRRGHDWPGYARLHWSCRSGPIRFSGVRESNWRVPSHLSEFPPLSLFFIMKKATYTSSNDGENTFLQAFTWRLTISDTDFNL